MSQHHRLGFHLTTLLGLGAVTVGLFSAPALAQDAAEAVEAATDEAVPERLLLNSATSEELAALDDVDDAVASAIVTLRDERGGELHSIEQLRIIPGIGEYTIDSLRRNTAVQVTFPVNADKRFTTVEEVLSEFAHEPTIQQVQEWSADYARLNPELVDRWMSASKTFALLPQLRVEGYLKDHWDQDFNYYPSDGIIDDPSDQVFDLLDQAGRQQWRYYKVQLTWDLDKLIMSSERIRVINESQDIVKLRDKVLTEATRLYFERRRVQVEILLKPKSDLHGQTKDYLRLMEITANLDALTGGTFSQALMR